MIEPNKREREPQATINFDGKIKNISTSETDWGTRTAYDVTIRTYDPNALILGTLKTGSKLKVIIEPNNEPEKANAKKTRK
jgi:hypothetical protein